jgi:hypothetical protein
LLKRIILTFDAFALAGEDFMSRKLVVTILAGFEGPVVAAVSLQRLCDKLTGRLSGFQLDKVCKMISGYLIQARPITDDGYRWFWGQYFSVGNGQVAILFPWSQDPGKSGGSRFDRAIAIYTCGAVSASEISDLLAQVAITLGEVIAQEDAAISRRFSRAIGTNPEGEMV